METIPGSHAERAKEKEAEREHTEDDLGRRIGVTPGSAYLIEPADEDEDEFVMVVTEVTNTHPDTIVKQDGDVYKRHHTTTRDDFEAHIRVHANLYRVRDRMASVLTTYDEPFGEDATLAGAAFGRDKFRRRRLEASATENGFIDTAVADDAL